jgi:hypothetical protein
MYYKLVEKFGPEQGDRWRDYLKWRGLNLTGFDSVDAILRPDLFEPASSEDWHSCVNADFKLGLITNLDYAKRIIDRYDNPDLVGVEIELEQDYVPQAGLLGFDIIDGYCEVSLVTNWGTDEEGIINQHVMPNGLIRDLGRALQLRDLLRKRFPEDSHAQDCAVWAVYRLDS